MEETRQKASYYVEKLGLKRHFNTLTGEITYQKEIENPEKNTRVVLYANVFDKSICLIMRQTFYKNKFDRDCGCYGVFGKPRYIENIENDIEDLQEKKGDEHELEN